MADDLWTIADMVANSLDLADIEVSDLIQAVPLYGRLPMVPSSKGADTHQYVKETAAPVVGFRAVNAGRDLDKSEDTLVTVTLTLLDWSWMCDKGLADAWMRGREWFIAREGMRHLRAALSKLEAQYINGTTDGDAAGFAGFADVLNALSNPMVLGAGGATNLSSVYFVTMGENDCVGVMQGDGMTVGETTIQEARDGSAKSYPAYYTPACTWTGIQLGSIYSIGRLANLDDGSNTLNDDLISQGLSLFPVDRRPNAIVMNRRSRQQLQASRTATNPTGAPAPFPDSAFGVPIITVESITNAETAVA